MGLVDPGDGIRRCAWAVSAPDYVEYHDTEWGVPISGDRAYFERLTYEGFQSGLSWLVIMRKRPAFRAAFADFDPERIARFGARDRQRLLSDAGIVRNRQKIDATITNAAALLRRWEIDGDGALERLMLEHRPSEAELRKEGFRRPPRTLADLPTQVRASRDLAKALKSWGFVFVGPTTLYAGMQANGLVNDHIQGCFRRNPTM
jgi:DNA-3-methyladenine glycosylase I